MTDLIKNKLDDFINRIENEEGDQAINDTIVYLQGFADNEEDPVEQKFLRGYIMNLKIIKMSNTNTEHLKKENKNIKSQLNKALRKIIKLEKRVDKLEIGKISKK